MKIYRQARNNYVILGIETSCDETAAAVLEQKNGCIQILSNVVASSALLQSKYGGIIPEQAAREQLKSMLPVIQEALSTADLESENLDVIAVTEGPGLIGSLLVGVETAKVLARIWDKPLTPVNHLLGHFYANWILGDVTSESKPSFPAIGLLVSGGHSDLVLFSSHQKYRYLGGTRDDAAGECFDKCARLLGLPYPGGPEISKLAVKGEDIYHLPRPMLDSKDFDFSFSGLKTAVANLVKAQPQILEEESSLANLCASIEAAITEVLVTKTVAAAKTHQVGQVIVAGGVAANQALVAKLQQALNQADSKIRLHIPPAKLCTDNAAMVAARAFFEKPTNSPLSLQANPNLSLAY